MDTNAFLHSCSHLYASRRSCKISTTYPWVYPRADPYPQLSTTSVRRCLAVVQQVRQRLAVFGGMSAGVFDECAGVRDERASIRWSAW